MRSRDHWPTSRKKAPRSGGPGPRSKPPEACRQTRPLRRSADRLATRTGCRAGPAPMSAGRRRRRKRKGTCAQ
eukprot:8037729-Pyramimonas_sp.AAC.1